VRERAALALALALALAAARARVSAPAGARRDVGVSHGSHISKVSPGESLRAVGVRDAARDALEEEVEESHVLSLVEVGHPRVD
jgi:hypothetical protein